MKPPRPFSALPSVIFHEASPKAISRRTSYIPVRLEFLRYPQVIPDYFNRRGFGPPQRFTAASTCSWIGHQVSGLRHATLRSIQTRFRFGSVTLSLNLATQRNSPARSTKSTTSHACGALSACKHTVSGSLSLPSRGAFHLSLTVLFAIGHMVVFSLRRWSSCLPSRFLVSRRTLDSPRFKTISPTRLLLRFVVLSNTVRLSFLLAFWGPNPAHIAICGLGSSTFARHYSQNRSYFLFLRVLRCFSSPGSPHIPIYSVYDTTTLLVVSSLIRISTDLGSFAAPRSFSQLVTSFFGAMYQGILRMLFVA